MKTTASGADAPPASVETRAAQKNLRAALAEGVELLGGAGVASAGHTAERLLMHAAGCDRAWLYTHTQDNLTPSQRAIYAQLLDAGAAGTPVQYLIGHQEFWGLGFEVSPAVLIPRPETEHVVEVALERLGGRSTVALRVADVGTGSGCLAIALARELPNARFVASDISGEALAVARRNAARHGVVERIEFAEMDLLQSYLGDSTGAAHRFDLIVSNPPYIALGDAATLQREVRDHEPHLALFGGPTGMDLYPRLIQQAAALLAPDGALVLELGFGLADPVRSLIEADPGWVEVGVAKDLAGIERVLAAQRVSAQRSSGPRVHQ